LPFSCVFLGRGNPLARASEREGAITRHILSASAASRTPRLSAQMRGPEASKKGVVVRGARDPQTPRQDTTNMNQSLTDNNRETVRRARCPHPRRSPVNNNNGNNL